MRLYPWEAQCSGWLSAAVDQAGRRHDLYREHPSHVTQALRKEGETLRVGRGRCHGARLDFHGSEGNTGFQVLGSHERRGQRNIPSRNPSAEREDGQHTRTDLSDPTSSLPIHSAESTETAKIPYVIVFFSKKNGAVVYQHFPRNLPPMFAVIGMHRQFTQLFLLSFQSS